MAELDLGALVFPGRSDEVLAALRVRHLMGTVRAFVSAGDSLEGERRSAHRRVAALVAKALAADAPALLDCFREPAVGAAIRCRAARDRWPAFAEKVDAAFFDLPPRLLLEMSARGLIDEAFDWTLGAPWLASSSIGARLTAPADASGWRFARNSVSVLGGAADGTFVRLSSSGLTRGRRPVQGLRAELSHVALSDGVRLALVDANPIAQLEAHPEKSGSVLDLGGHSEDDWRSSLQTTLDWIREATPGLSREIALLLREIVPVGYDAERHSSASYQEAIGVIYMTLHPNPLVMAEALIHEFQHNKLNLASYEDRVLENAFSPLYPSPVRPDPRPLWGVLLGVHALLPVARFYRRLAEIGHPASRTPEFVKRLAELDRKNEEGMETLRRHAKWTAAGRGVFAGLEALQRGTGARRARAA